jgi:3-methylcrotonyl-CoA carboxylase alpha subunit
MPELRLPAQRAPIVDTASFLLDGERVEAELDGEGTDEPVAASPARRGRHGLGAHALAQGWQPRRARRRRRDPGARCRARVIAVEVTVGDTVTKGQKLLTLEAMKMEHTLTAPFDGVVAELNAAPGAQVQVEALLGADRGKGQE